MNEITITSDELKKSGNKYVQTYITNGLENKLRKKDHIIIKRNSDKSGLAQLAEDFNRSLNAFDIKEADLQKNLDKAQKIVALGDLLKEKIGAEQCLLLDKHYSQVPSYLLDQVIVRMCASDTPMDDPVKIRSAVHSRQQLYREGEDVYLKCISKEFPVFGELDKKIGCIGEHPTEIIYKLTKEGFEFQTLTTKSKLIATNYKKGFIEPNKVVAEAQKYHYEQVKMHLQLTLENSKENPVLMSLGKDILKTVEYLKNNHKKLIPELAH